MFEKVSGDTTVDEGLDTSLELEMGSGVMLLDRIHELLSTTCY